MNLGQLFTAVARSVDELRGYELLASLSRFHRLQGSDELVIAAEHVAQLFDELGIEYRFESLQGPLGLHEYWGFWEPRGWRLESATIEARGENGEWHEVLSNLDTPLIAMAGSPPGEEEGILRFEEGNIRLVRKFNTVEYYEADEEGVNAVIGLHKGPGIRYWGLFPPHFRDPPRTLAASINYEQALLLVGKKVRIRIDSSYDVLSKTPILRASIGDGAASIVLVAHICHPRPGSHDNASGVAVLVEALAALQHYSEKLSNAGIRVEAFFVPEWTGLAAADIHGILNTEEALLGLSVDMVAANLAITGGRLRLVASPPPLINPFDIVLDEVLGRVDAENYGGIVPYEPGSDHDILVSLGVPGSMLNEWPDAYYHTSLDTPDHVSVTRIKKISAAIASSIILFTEKIRDIGSLVKRSIAPYYSTVEEGLLSEFEKYAVQRLKKLLRGSAAEPQWNNDITVVKRGAPTLAYLYLSGEKSLAKRLANNRDMYEAMLRLGVLASGVSSLEVAVKILQSIGLRLDEEVVGVVRKHLAGELDPARKH
ncbi:hypothetical protein PYJP_10210 [Pyrofollis japonicus]|uniref:M28 family peptidase n=1 Tax=Pyrofollis japonicus TaxID=3060460 RepID=UPI00295AD997|nr:M28 family peptidase [Pyrofollis japonicus]BEP17669.1 hypothetical protein PYJP_10210 [Pyrofollis japonicus]